MYVRRQSTTCVSTGVYFIVCLACFVDSLWALGKNRDTEFTFLIPAGRIECFYQTTSENGTMEVEYQVIGGAGLDVDFSIFSPDGGQLRSDFRRSDGIHTVEPTEKGDYKICFDNSFSHVSEKMVFFEVILEGEAGEVDGADAWTSIEEPESMLEYKLEDIKGTVESVHKHLVRSRQMQTLLRAFEARDRNLLEDNLWRVSFWSCASLLVMLAVAVTQVYTVRSLFSNKRVVPT